MKLDAQLGTTAFSLLHTPQPPTPEAVLAVLVRELTSRDSGNFALVLDDYTKFFDVQMMVALVGRNRTPS
jgi:ATP/maltotriose-dependent transcriptional regulator MalT